jgi:hypothetical protein
MSCYPPGAFLLRRRICPLLFQKQTLRIDRGMSALCQEATLTSTQRLQPWGVWDVYIRRARGFEIWIGGAVTTCIAGTLTL